MNTSDLRTASVDDAGWLLEKDTARYVEFFLVEDESVPLEHRISVYLVLQREWRTRKWLRYGEIAKRTGLSLVEVRGVAAILARQGLAVRQNRGAHGRMRRLYKRGPRS